MMLSPQPDRDAISGLRRTCRRLAYRLSLGGTVLAYHGIRSLNDEQAVGTMHVGNARFAETVHALRRLTTVIPLGELVTRHLRGHRTKGLSALTFDDAYASAGSAIQAVLESDPIPVTVFVVLDGAVKGKAFWWDRVDAVFGAASVEQWRAFEDACGVPQSYRSGQPAALGRLRPMRQWILAEHVGRWPASLEQPLAEAEVELQCQSTQRPMNFAELDRLLQNPLVDVGAHTVSHPVLPLLSDDEIRGEIRTSFDAVQARYPRALPVLTPPYGLYDARTVRIGKEEGMTPCLTLQPATLDASSNGDLIPRIGMTAGCPPWKAVLYSLGCWRGVRRHHVGPIYPDLPSVRT
jgi:peptidoglycan/xylan/chitin deacetylase (PgdA/CDA1 family)